MLDECDAVCFLPDWTESKGAMYDFGRAAAKDKRIFLYEAWHSDQLKKSAQKREAQNAENAQTAKI
jgi:hypothetical protein